MRFSQKIRKLGARETYARIGRKVRRAAAPIAVRPLLAEIDGERLHEIQQRYAQSPENYAKYADVERWLRRHVRKVQDLRLNRSAPKAILDLGCGGGFFLFIARHFGHTIQGLDLDEFPLLGELVELLKVPRVAWRIQALQPLPNLSRKFDLITAFSTRFNRDASDREVWGVEEWRFFLDDLQRHLAPGGEIFLEINSGKSRSFYPSELRQFFRSRGARLERDYVHFRF